MTYRLGLSRQTRSYFSRLAPKIQARMTARFELLCSDPLNPSYSKRLHGSELRSSRVGDLRIVFAIYQDEILVFIERIGPRGEVYRGL